MKEYLGILINLKNSDWTLIEQHWHVVTSHSLLCKKYYIFTPLESAHIWTHFSQLQWKLFWFGFHHYSSFNSNNIIIIFQKWYPVPYYGENLCNLEGILQNFDETFRKVQRRLEAIEKKYCVSWVRPTEIHEKNERNF